MKLDIVQQTKDRFIMYCANLNNMGAVFWIFDDREISLKQLNRLVESANANNYLYTALDTEKYYKESF